MKYYAHIQSERGKIVGTGGNEYLDIDIMEGNSIIASFTVRDGKVYDEDDHEIKRHK